MRKEEFDPIAYILEPRWQESRLGLDRMVALLDAMGNPQNSLKFVHVAGTNGKGSTSAYLASILRCAGYKTGLFTSPHVFSFTERIQLDGAPISPEDLLEVTLFVRTHAEALAEQTGDHPTEFELMAAVAFEYFTRVGADIVVLEVGLGGRLDATNVIAAPQLAVITPITLDHTEILGSNLKDIAAEKAGIIKPGTAVVSAPQLPEVAEVLRAAAEEAKAPITFLNLQDLTQESIAQCTNGEMVRQFSYKGETFETRLLGTYQPENAALALLASWALGEKGWTISSEALRCGIVQATWPGRFEVASTSPVTVVLDGAHNPDGAKVLAESLKDCYAKAPVVFVMGVLADKDYEAMIAEVAPMASAFVCVTPPSPRALAAKDLAGKLRAAAEQGAFPKLAKDFRNEPMVAWVPDAMAAIYKAQALATKLSGIALNAGSSAANIENAAPPEESAAPAIVCVFGSLYSLGDFKAALESMGQVLENYRKNLSA